MDAELDADSRLTLSFGAEDELSGWVEETRTQAGFVVPLAEPLKLFTAIEVRLVCDAEPRGEARAEVAQVFPGAGSEHQTAFLLDPASLKLRPGRAAGAGEVDGSSPIFQIKTMNVSQKARLAQRAGRGERQILLRDSSPQVLQGLLFNPRVETKEVLQIVKSTHSNAPILQRVAADPRWGKNAEVLATVAKNPKTPTPFATRLIEKLRTSDLRVMAKMSSGMREAVRRAALREYLRRTSKR